MTALALADDHRITASNLSDLYHHCDISLAKYAIPRFIRIQSDIQLTPTLKHVKTDLVKEGFDAKLCGGDELFFWDLKHKTYSKLDSVAYEAILSREIRM